MVVSVTALLDNLKGRGSRITSIRRALITILSHARKPLSVQEVLAHLRERGMKANKTTIYRQLEMLQHYRVVRPLRLDERTMRYELIHDDNHHHHLVCVRCNRIEDINFADDLKKQEAIIRSSRNFRVLRHSLEFFGICQACQRKSKNAR